MYSCRINSDPSNMHKNGRERDGKQCSEAVYSAFLGGYTKRTRSFLCNSNVKKLPARPVRKKCSWWLTKVGHSLTGTSSFVCRKLIFREINFKTNPLKIVLWRLRIHSQNNSNSIFRNENQKTKPKITNPGLLD